jgi:hypothetical protein
LCRRRGIGHLDLLMLGNQLLNPLDVFRCHHWRLRGVQSHQSPQAHRPFVSNCAS